MKFEDFNLKQVGQEVLLVGGIWSGAGNTYFCYFPEYGIPDADTHTLEMDDEAWQQLLRQSDLVETEVLQKQQDGKLYKAIMRKCQRNIQQGVSWAVFRRDQYRCRYCGNDQVPLTVDHLVLWEEGGPSIEKNLVAACRKCNKTRGNTQYKDWLKHPYYLKVSKKLPSAIRALNSAVLVTLDGIPRAVHKRKR